MRRLSGSSALRAALGISLAPDRIALNAPTGGGAGHLSIAVLPFTNLSGDASQDYFADGITENLTTDLSRIRNCFVIARNTAFTFKGKNVDAKRSAGNLVCAMFSKVRSSATRTMFVSTRNSLMGRPARISGPTALRRTSPTYLSSKIKWWEGWLIPCVTSWSEQRRKRHVGSKDPDAIDLTMRGRALLWPPFTKDKYDAAHAYFERALQFDPNSSEALAGDALAYTLEFVFGSRNSETDYDIKILGTADRSIAVARDNMLAYRRKSFYLLVSPSSARRISRRRTPASAIDPNSASLLATRSIAETYLRQFEQAKSDVQQAMRLSPARSRVESMAQFPGRRRDWCLAISMRRLKNALRRSMAAIAFFIRYLNLAACTGSKGI